MWNYDNKQKDDGRLTIKEDGAVGQIKEVWVINERGGVEVVSSLLSDCTKLQN